MRTVMRSLFLLTVVLIVPAKAESERPQGFWSTNAAVVNEARRHLGSKAYQLGLPPTLWCADFMNLVLERAGYRPSGSRNARAFARYGTRLKEPQVGAIAVMPRGPDGGHVGVVSAIDGKKVTIVSGNHNDQVEEATYPRGVFFAYVLPQPQ